jgi:hypothetical protein
MNNQNISIGSINDLSKFTKIDEREIDLIWSNEWWDGPIDGLVKFN